MATAFRPAAITDTFEAFVIGDKGRTYPLDSADSLDECKSLAAGRVPHKGQFFIRHTDGLSGAVMLSFYAIKRSSKGARRWQYAESRVVHDLYAEHLFDLAGEVL